MMTEDMDERDPLFSERLKTLLEVKAQFFSRAKLVVANLEEIIQTKKILSEKIDFLSQELNFVKVISQDAIKRTLEEKELYQTVLDDVLSKFRFMNEEQKI